MKRFWIEGRLEGLPPLKTGTDGELSLDIYQASGMGTHKAVRVRGKEDNGALVLKVVVENLDGETSWSNVITVPLRRKEGTWTEG